MLFTLYLIVALLASERFPCLTAVEAALTSSSSIEYCEKTDQTALACKKKMITTISVTSGQAAGTEEVIFIRGAKDKTSGDGNDEVTFEPVSVTVSKSQVQYRYPLFYVRNFNAKPYEEQLLTGLMNQCNDSPDPKKATCGVKLDAQGRPVPYSQGFCCQCSLCEVSGMCASSSRGLSSCNVFGKTAAASCLRFGPLWYSGYSVGSGVFWYRISLRLSTTNGGSKGQNRTANLHLGPGAIADFSTEFQAKAQLVGDFSPPETPLILTEKMLFIPSSPKKHKRVEAGSSEWIILDRRFVSETGSECNKVGVSYKAFVSQGNACGVRPGSCLGEQIEDYRNRDIKSKRSGKNGQYMARDLGDFIMSKGNDTGSPYLAYWMRGSLATMITLTMTADNLKYVVSVSPGKIVAVSTSRETIAASTRDGVVTVKVQNTGNITAEYTVGVGECTKGVLPMISQPVSMKPQEILPRRFNLLVQDIFSNGTVRCVVSMRNARGEVIDTKPLQVKVVPVAQTNGAQGGKSAADGAVIAKEAPQTCDDCHWYNLICFLMMRCSWQPLIFLLPIMAAIYLVSLCFR